MNTYDKYKRARDMAWKFLIKHMIYDFPFNVNELLKKLNISISTVKNFAMMRSVLSDDTINALTCKTDNRYHIFYKPKDDIKKLRFTIAHEIGHIMMEHIKSDVSFFKFNDYAESEANIFATRILMPIVVIRHCNLDTPQKIADYFDVPIYWAEFRHARYVNILIPRNAFLKSPLERKYYNLFNKHIN